MKVSYSVHFFIKYEQYFQIEAYVTEDSVADIIPGLKQQFWAELRAKKVISEYSKKDVYADLGIAVLGTTDISKVGNTFAKGCYTV